MGFETFVIANVGACIFWQFVCELLGSELGLLKRLCDVEVVRRGLALMELVMCQDFCCLLCFEEP